MPIRAKNAADMKWYLYRSDTKLRMLFQQIAKTSAKKAIEWKAGYSGVGLSRKSESNDEVDEDEMLKAVTERLEYDGLVGTLEEPNLYIKGIMPMRWGMYNDLGRRDAAEGPLVYFGGLDKDMPMVLALGGSSKHVIGHEGATSTYSRSSTPALVDALCRGIETGEFERVYPKEEREEDGIYRAIAIAQHYLRPPTQNLEFFAKTLMVGDVIGVEQYIGIDKTKVILGTPLYVALAAPYPNDDHWGIIPDEPDESGKVAKKAE
jgi:hypothetical protein